MTDTSKSALLKQVAYIAAYMLTSIAIVFFNRWLFTDIYPYPVFVSWVQQIIGLILYYTLAVIGIATKKPLFLRFHFEKINPWILYSCIPQVLTFALSVGLANLCLEYVQVSTYQVARSLTLIFSIILTKYILGTMPERLALVGVAFICSGFILNSFDPQTLTFSGLALGAGSSFFQALNTVLVSRNMEIFENDGQRLLLYNLAGASIAMFPLIFLCGEADAFSYLPLDGAHDSFMVRWLALLGSGFFCILINLTTFMCINATSPVSMIVIGFSKSIFQSVGSILFLGDIVTAESVIALFMSLGGTGIYTFAQVKKQNLDQETQLDVSDDLEVPRLEGLEGQILSSESPRPSPRSYVSTPSAPVNLETTGSPKYEHIPKFPIESNERCRSEDVRSEDVQRIAEPVKTV